MTLEGLISVLKLSQGCFFQFNSRVVQHASPAVHNLLNANPSMISSIFGRGSLRPHQQHFRRKKGHAQFLASLTFGFLTAVLGLLLRGKPVMQMFLSTPQQLDKSMDILRSS